MQSCTKSWHVPINIAAKRVARSDRRLPNKRLWVDYTHAHRRNSFATNQWNKQNADQYMPTTSLYCCKLFPIFTSLHALLKIQCRSKVRFRGGGNHERRGRELLGGSEGMLPLKVLKYRVSEIAFSALREHQFPAIFRRLKSLKP